MKHARPDYQRLQDPEGKIPADEPVFLLRGQDALAAIALMFYADLSERAGVDKTIVEMTRHQAEAMLNWPTKKLADLPDRPRAELHPGIQAAVVRGTKYYQDALATCGLELEPDPDGKGEPNQDALPPLRAGESPVRDRDSEAAGGPAAVPVLEHRNPSAEWKPNPESLDDVVARDRELERKSMETEELNPSVSAEPTGEGKTVTEADITPELRQRILDENPNASPEVLDTALRLCIKRGITTPEQLDAYYREAKARPASS